MSTIRQHFRLRYRAMIAALVAIVVIGLLARRLYFPNAAYLQPVVLGVVVPLVLAPFMIAYMMKAHRCPGCGTPFHKMEGKRSQWDMLTDRRMYWDRWEACPKCGIRFDAEMPSGPSNPTGS